MNHSTTDRMQPSSVMGPVDGAPTVAGATLDVLLRAMQSGNPALVEQAWAECYLQFSQKVWTRVLYVIRTMPGAREPHEIAIDVTSEVFARLPEAARHYREMGAAEPWLMLVAVRAALREKARITGIWSSAGSRTEEVTARPIARVRVDLEDAVREIVALTEGADDEDKRIELARRLETWRNDPGKHRWMEFVELFIQGYAHEEIAERMGIATATARTLLLKIRRELGRASSGGSAE